MNPANFPARKRARRFKALARLGATIGSPDRVLKEAAVLRERTMGSAASARDERTKKTRSIGARFTRNPA